MEPWSKFNFPRSTYHTRLGSDRLKPSNSYKRLETNFPGASNFKIRILGSLGRLLRGWKAPSQDAFSVSSPEMGEPTETWVGNSVQSQGMESYSPNLPEPSSGQPGARSFPSPTHSPPPTQADGWTVYAAEPPAGGATGPAAAGCRLMERGSADIPGSVPLASSGQSAPPWRARQGPRPANRDPRITRREGGVSDIKGAWEMLGSAMRKIDR